MIWTARHWHAALSIAEASGQHEAEFFLLTHAPHADHCGGYEVLAWPCPIAAKVLDELLDGAA